MPGGTVAGGLGGMPGPPVAGSLPAYSGGTVWDSHPLPLASGKRRNAGMIARARGRRGRRRGPRRDGVDTLAATLGCPGPDGAVTVEAASAARAAGVEEEASSRPGAADAGLDLEPDAQPAQAGHRRVGRRVDVPAAAARANLSTPPPGGPAAPWR